MVFLAHVAGVLLLGVFAINAYIAAKDTSLSQLQPVHEIANSLMACLDLVSSSILLYYGRARIRAILLGGIAWPVAFLFSVFADIETRMCLFTGTNCFASVGDSYQYLILGSIAEGWKLWKYTIPTAIILLLLAALLSSIYIAQNWPEHESRTTASEARVAGTAS
jgi:hypothetical protein